MGKIPHLVEPRYTVVENNAPNRAEILANLKPKTRCWDGMTNEQISMTIPPPGRMGSWNFHQADGRKHFIRNGTDGVVYVLPVTEFPPYPWTLRKRLTQLEIAVYNGGQRIRWRVERWAYTTMKRLKAQWGGLCG